MIRVWLWSMLKSWLSIANQSVLDLINERFSFTYYRATYASLALLFSQNFIYIMIDVPRTSKYQLIFHYNYISYLPVTAMVKFIPTLDSGKYCLPFVTFHLQYHFDNICSSLLFVLLLLLLFFIIRFAYFSFQFSNICNKFLWNKNTAKFAQEALGPYRLSKRQKRPALLM